MHILCRLFLCLKSFEKVFKTFDKSRILLIFPLQIFSQITLLYYFTTMGKQCYTVKTIYDVPDIPLYPDTSENRIGYRINVEGFLRKDVENLISRVSVF
jgi:hypothetical protein